MKKLFFEANYGIALLMGTVVILSSCSEEVMDPENQKVYAPVSVQVSGFSVSMSDFPNTRAVDPSSYEGVGAITLAFYDSNGGEAYKVTQFKSENAATFEQFSCSLPVGSYTLVAVGYGYFSGDVFVLTSPTEAEYTSALPRETFCATQSVSITDATPLNLSITLDRINTKLTVNSTDHIPVGATKVRTTYAAACKGFNPTTGLAANTNGFSVVNTIRQINDNQAMVANFAFLATDIQTMNITLEVLDASDNVLCTKVVSDVPFKRNRVTVLEGRLFTPSSASSASFTLNTDWLDEYNVTF